MNLLSITVTFLGFIHKNHEWCNNKNPIVHCWSRCGMVDKTGIWREGILSLKEIWVGLLFQLLTESVEWLRRTMVTKLGEVGRGWSYQRDVRRCRLNFVPTILGCCVKYVILSYAK
jgi:hypothetical protein